MQEDSLLWNDNGENQEGYIVKNSPGSLSSNLMYMHETFTDVVLLGDSPGIQLKPTQTFLNSFCLETNPKPGIPASSPLPDGSIHEQHISMHIYNMTTCML